MFQPQPLAMFGLGVPELLIILAVVLLLFGGSRLAGLGKSTGRALKEFKEETKGLKPEDKADQPSVSAGEAGAAPTNTAPTGPVQAGTQAGAPQSQPSPTYQQYQPPQPPATPSQNPDGSDIRKDG
jgi:sec-independent protein translocase protein TatA